MKARQNIVMRSIFFICFNFLFLLSTINANGDTIEQQQKQSRQHKQKNSVLEYSISLRSNSKYNSKDLHHFDYVNPDAPKYGTFHAIEIGSFDSLNIFASKGTPAGCVLLIYDTLMTANKEEPSTVYPLIAESLQLLANNQGIIFNLNKSARFHDGTPLTANDVAYSFKLLTEKGNVSYRTYYAGIRSVTIINEYSVQFNFNDANNLELPYIISQLPVLPKHFWEQNSNNFTESSVNIPLGSGPYKIDSVTSEKNIILQRVHDYWGKDLAVNKGRYNFDKISYDYFADANAAREALQTQKYDFFQEMTAKNWSSFKDTKAAKNQYLTMHKIPTLDIAPIQGFVFNLRKNKFKNIYTRQAITQLFDFDKINYELFNNDYLRSISYFSNSFMSATAIPSADETELLAPWKNNLPEDLFSKSFILPEGSFQERKSVALELLKKAGWYLEDGKLKDTTGQNFTITFLTYDNMYDKIFLAFADYLKSVGISVVLKSVDLSVYYNSLKSFDFDMVIYAWRQSHLPGNEQYFFWGSEFSDTPNSQNLVGIKNPVVDAMIDNVTKAKNKKELEASVKALDRVLLWGYYIIPQWYFPYYRIVTSKSVTMPSDTILYGLDIYSWYFIPKDDSTTIVSKQESTALWYYLLLAGILTVIILYRKKKKQQLNANDKRNFIVS